MTTDYTDGTDMDTACGSKSQIPSTKSQTRGSQPPKLQMEDSAKPRDLEDRTFRFAESVRTFVKQLPRTISNAEDIRQLVRASGSVAANWIEADEALSKKVRVGRAICLGFGAWDLISSHALAI